MLARRAPIRRTRVRPLRAQRKALAGASGFFGLAIPKGETRSVLDERAHRMEVAIIKAVRAKVFLRDTDCTVCHGLRRRMGQCVKPDDEMNEIVPRSATRGLPPEERFNVHNCHRACDACHRDITENRVRVSGDAHAKGGLVIERPTPKGVLYGRL